MYKVSIIIPALNEESNIKESIENVINTFNRLSINGEIIIINDGSVDKTGLIAEEYQSNYNFIKLIHNDKTKGVGAAYWEGVRKSSGEIITWIPGDAENDCHESLRYLSLMNEVDIVIPFIYNKEIRTWKRRIPSIIYKLIINLSFGTLLNYINGGVIYRRCILENIELKSKGFFFQTELLMKCLRKEYLYAEVPLTIKQRGSGNSKAFTLKSLLMVFGSYLSTMSEIYLKSSDKTIVDESMTAKRRKQVKPR